METQELKEVSGKVAELAGLITGWKDESEAKYKAIDELLKAQTVLIDGQKTTISNLEKTQAAAEKRFERERFGAGNKDNTHDRLLGAIPDRMRGNVQLLARTGCKDPARVVAQETYLKNCIRMSNPGAFQVKDQGALMEEMDKLLEAMGEDVHQKVALNETTGAQGGFLVPVVTEAEVMRKIEDVGVVRPLARKLTMTSETHQIPKLNANVTVQFDAEAATITSAEPTFTQLTLQSERQTSLATASMEVIQDSAVGLLDFVFTLMTEEAALAEDKEALEGDGTTFTGLSDETSVIQLIQDDGAGVDTNGGVLTYEFLVKTKWGVVESSSRRGSAWIMHTTMARAAEGLVDSQGRPVWSNPSVGSTALFGRGDSQAVGLLLGFPAHTSSQPSITRTRGALTTASNIYFGPFGHGMIYGDRMGTTLGVSEHVNWATGQLSLRMIRRVAILVAQGNEFVRLTGVDAS